MLIVSAHADEVDAWELLAGEVVEAVLCESVGDLPSAVASKVPEDDRVLSVDCGDWLSVFNHDDGLNVVIGGVALPISVVDGLQRVGLLPPLALGEKVVSLQGPVPVRVPIHRVVAAHHGRNPADALLPDLLQHLLDEALC